MENYGILHKRWFSYGIISKTKKDKKGKVKKTEYAIANKGTTPTSESDWLNNILQPIGMSKDMKNSISKAKEWAKKYKSYSITFTGHSKGGAEAAANAVATNKRCIIFNPAIPNYSAYGLSTSSYKATMTSYVVKEEILNFMLGKVSLAKTVYLPQQYGNFLYTSIDDRIKNHSMEAVIKALKEKGCK